MKTLLISIFILLKVSVNICAAEVIVIGGFDGQNPNTSESNGEIALAISGGGARGLTTIGILKAFEEKGLSVKAIAGVSMGGVIGGLYASGYTPDELMEFTNELSFDNMFYNNPKRSSMFFTQREEHGRHLLSIRFNRWVPVIPKALTKGQGVTSVLTKLTTKANYHSRSDFLKLPIPFKTFATDIISGKGIIIENGSLADAMRATMAFPLAFTPVEKNGMLLMDGGMLCPIPVDLARTISNSIKFVVAINTSSQLLNKEGIKTPLDIANQVTSIMTNDKLLSQLSKASYVITPPIQQYASSDFAKKDSIIAIGYRAGISAADSIISMIKKNEEIKYSINKIEIDSITIANNKDIIESLNIEEFESHQSLTKKLKNYYLNNNIFLIKAELIPDLSNINRNYNLKISTEPQFDHSQVSFIFNGNSIYDDTTLLSVMALGNYDLSSEKIKKSLHQITGLYRVNGYDFVDIESIEFNIQDKSFIINIDEAIIKSIDIEKNHRSRDWFIRSHFPLKPNQPYSTSDASVGIANIYGTDLFNQVSLNLINDTAGSIVKISVEEKHYQQVRLGWHWDDEYKSEEFLEYLDDNVLGMGLKYLLHARFAIDRQEYFGYFKSNRIWSTYLTAKAEIYHNRINRFIFDDESNEIEIRKEIKTGFSFSLGQQIKRFGTVTAKFDVVNYDDRYLVQNIKNKRDLRIFSIKSSIENFDRSPLTLKGSKHFFEVQMAGKFMGGDEEYNRFEASTEIYIPINHKLNYHPKFAIGLSSSGLPPSERFYLGGIESFSGFRTYQLNGDKFIMLSNDLRLKLPFRFYFTFRHDIGEVYTHTDEIKLRNLRNGISLILSFDSPIGPFDFRYGFADSDNDRYYINIGLDF